MSAAGEGRGVNEPPSASPGRGRRDLLRLLRLMAPQRAWMLAGAALALLALLANVGLLAVSGWFIAAMALAGASGAVFDYFTPAALIRGLAIARTGGRYLERLATHEATFRILARLRVWLYLAIEPLAPARLDLLRSADLLSRMQADIDTLNQVYLRLLLPAGVAAVASLGMLAAVALFSPLFSLLVGGWLALAGVGVPWWAWRRGRDAAAGALLQRNLLRIEVADALAGALDLRVYGAEELALRRVDRASAELLRHQRRLSDLAGLSGAAVGLCANLAVGSALVLLLPAVAAGRTPPAQLPMLALFALGAFEAVAPLPLAFQMLGEMLAAARRVFELADTPPAVSEPAIREAGPMPGSGALELRGLRMRYAEGLPWVLDGLDLDLPAGARLALVGASGAGKSSLLQVLTRLREYQQGSVRVGGRELRELRGDDARSLFTVVGQDDYLFHGTVLDNLLLGDPDASPAQVYAACRAAQLHEFLESLPEGYLTPLGEGGMRLSGGQARRLGIARALLRDGPVLLLDEPTDALDANTERELYEALSAAMRGRSVLLITHRLGALAALVDEVAVLERGRIAWRGPVARWREAARDAG
ncbi:MAG: thiol reductant ABC exporter subunit CydC [Betaproteobacteria bacterium]|nr:thiol reductant ABC exporter subunit CydC [Betaproteobacteria bacterium]